MKIAILDGAVLNPGDVDWAPIASLGDVSIYETTPTEAVAERTRGADVVLVNKTPLGATDVRSLSEALRRAAGDKADPVIVINADAKATHQSVVDIMQAAQVAGYPRISFATQSPH